MKKLITLAIVAFIAFNAFAQDKNATAPQSKDAKKAHKDSLKKAYKSDSIKVKKVHRAKI